MTYYNEKDLVFGKMKGYPPWPARIQEVVKKTSDPKTSRYKVFFFGTYDNAIMKGVEICNFNDFKEKLGSPKKTVNFNKAMKEVVETPYLEPKPVVESDSSSESEEEEKVEPKAKAKKFKSSPASLKRKRLVVASPSSFSKKHKNSDLQPEGVISIDFTPTITTPVKSSDQKSSGIKKDQQQKLIFDSPEKTVDTTPGKKAKSPANNKTPVKVEVNGHSTGSDNEDSSGDESNELTITMTREEAESLLNMDIPASLREKITQVL